jgi:hypothetical protein
VGGGIEKESVRRKDARRSDSDVSFLAKTFSTSTLVLIAKLSYFADVVLHTMSKLSTISGTVNRTDIIPSMYWTITVLEIGAKTISSRH